MDEYETVLLVKQEVFVFKIPPRATNRGYRASDWKLDAPDWTGRMRLVVKGNKCILKLEDKNTGELFAQSPFDNHPGIALEPVLDSSRYFVLRIEDDNGRSAFIGIGFGDRGDSFDLNVALQDHFKWLQKSEEIDKEAESDESKPNLDLGFKEGQTITINMNIGKKSGSAKPRPKPSASGAVPGLLPPPPGGLKTSPVSGQKPFGSFNIGGSLQEKKSAGAVADANSLLLDLDSPGEAKGTQSSDPIPKTTGSELWGDFTAAGANEDSFP